VIKLVYMLEQALVFICSAVVFVPIFQRLGLGSVLGYLIAGILVGPHGFKLIHDSESAMHLAELGVVLLLFMIGLEIQPRKLWSMRRHLLGLGGTQIVLTSVILFGIGLALGIPMITSAVIAFALSLSSTAFALQTLSEQNQLNTEFGRSSFSILLMQDLVAIPALALIPALGSSSSTSGPTLQGALLIIGVIAILIVASRFFIRPLFRYLASTRSREIFTAATLLIVLGVAALMQKVGLSAALGTFIAGVLLADSEYRHELESDLEPFKSLLMGLFFIAVGMGVSTELLLAEPLNIFGLALAYLVIKFSVIYTSGRLFKAGHQNSTLMALTIAQGGEFAFVIFTIALQHNLAPSNLITTLTAVITLSMAINPILSIAYRTWSEKRAKIRLKPNYDEIRGEEPVVIIAGFGRFGQVFGRLLKSQDIPFVAIDHDPDQIELVRRFGNKVYYGDASRRELLEAAGAAKARFFVLAIDDVEASLDTAKIVKEHFPHLKIFARARNRGHAFDFMELGLTHIKRETFDASVYFAQDLLIEMGYSPERAADMAERFKQHDEIMLKKQFEIRSDDKMFVSVSKQATAQLAEVLRQDSMQSYIDPRHKDSEVKKQNKERDQENQGLSS
jgi:monovalent cation:proton antiporter-2 (CPA2) family protein